MNYKHYILKGEVLWIKNILEGMNMEKKKEEMI